MKTPEELDRESRVLRDQAIIARHKPMSDAEWKDNTEVCEDACNKQLALMGKWNETWSFWQECLQVVLRANTKLAGEAKYWKQRALEAEGEAP